MPRKPKLSAAMEDYLEAILRLSGKGGVARVRDIAGAVGVTLSTVSGALQKLAQAGLVNYEPYEIVTLTPQGSEVAGRISRRHELLAKLFREILGVPPRTAEADACRLEHGLSRETVDRLVAFMEFLEDCPRAGPDWVERFRKRCRGKPRAGTCLKCIRGCLPKTRARPSGRGERPRGSAG